MKILIAEDEPSVSQIYQIVLEDSGHEIMLTKDGNECVTTYSKELSKFPILSQEYLQSHPPFDVVILDYRMPIMDGIEVARFILKNNPYQRIILASAYMMSTLEESAKELGRLIELLQKPFEMDLLIAKLEEENRKKTDGDKGFEISHVTKGDDEKFGKLGPRTDYAPALSV